MQKRTLSVLLLLVLAIAALSVNAQDDPIAEVDPTGATITYWHEWDGAQGEAMNEIIAGFNESNEWGITVEQNPLGTSSAISDSVSAGITSGELPNLVGNGFIGNAMGWYLDGIVAPLDVYVDSPTWGLGEADQATISQDLLAINRPQLAPFNNQLLAWPIGVSGNVMSVNLDLLNQLRESGAIDFEGAPQTFEQFRTAACAASELEGVTAGFAARAAGGELFSFILNNGGYIFDQEADAYNFTNPQAIEAMQFVQDLYNDGCSYFADGGFFANTGEFSLGLNVFAAGSSVGVPFIQRDMDTAELDYNWINTKYPSAEGSSTMETFLRGLVMFESTPEQKLATWLFIKYWATNSDVQVLWTESAQYQPYNTATASNLSSEFLESNAQFNSFAEVLADDSVTLWSQPIHPRNRDIAVIAGELYTNITIGGMDVTEAATAAEAAANELYQEILEDLSDA